MLFLVLLFLPTRDLIRDICHLCTSLRASSPIWASETSLARTAVTSGGCHFFNLRHVYVDSFHALPSPGVSGVEMKIYERSLQALLSSVPRSRVLARLASLAQIGELAPRLSLHMCKELCHVTLFHGLKLEKLDQLFKILILSLKNSFLEISKQQWIYPPVKKSCHCREVAVSRGLKFFLDHLTFILMS